VLESGADSAIPIRTMPERIQSAAEHGFTNLSFIEGDLTDRAFVSHVFDTFRFDCVVHAAAQPSAPYSHINGERAAFTQFNNNQSTLNLLWAVKEKGLAAHCHFIETTTMGVYGAPEFELPEGFVTAQNRGRSDLIPFPGMAGSWYHMSKANDVNLLHIAHKLWRLSITDLRTAIVYGTETEETATDARLATRFDFDFYFGVVLNRFCAMAITGHPITIYGKGLQRKPQISLEDCVQSIVNAVKTDGGPGLRVRNQTTEVVSITDLAASIQKSARDLDLDVEITHIPNPRVEKEEHEMTVDTENFRKLLPVPKHTIASGTLQTLRSLHPYRERIRQYKDRFMTESVQ
jgi:nucleoside-diphosphate-sugar epimerase